jgi:hypothetical protein
MVLVATALWNTDKGGGGSRSPTSEYIAAGLTSSSLLLHINSQAYRGHFPCRSSAILLAVAFSLSMLSSTELADMPVFAFGSWLVASTLVPIATRFAAAPLRLGGCFLF